MRIAINAGLLSERAFGIRTYLENLVRALLVIDGKNRYFLLAGGDDIARPAGNASVVKPAWALNNYFLRNLWEQTALPLLLDRISPDIFHSPDHILPLMPAKGRKVITVHDLAFFRLPGAYSLRKRAFKHLITPVTVRRADRIIADSDNTKKDIIEYFGTDPEKIDVIHLGVGEEFKVISDEAALGRAREKYGLNRPFIMFVGTIEPRKNIKRLVEAFISAVKDKKISEDLVIVGNNGWLFKDILSFIKEQGMGRVKIIDSMRQEDLPLVYNCAELFIYPSLYEGFGLPPLEAMACGVPTVTSNTSSLPEVVGDAAIKVNPCNTGNISDAIVQVLSDPRIKKSLSEKGLERAKLFTWEAAARRTIATYEKVLR
ncbi:MAG: glycosyltransferase family 1 protein [Candidatus Saganbacteria bacterium]|nr:glycosyltransferase family 1 protein [Candidatus Saganbacteria bacterium]